MSSCPNDPVRRCSLVRWLYAAVGLLCVAAGAVGVVLPGLPTTIFLIIATWFFTRSCPWLERKLIRENRLFAPFVQFLEPGAVMPIRIRIGILIAMWVCVSISTLVLVASGAKPTAWIWLIPCSALIGSYFILRFGASGTAAVHPSSVDASGSATDQLPMCTDRDEDSPHTRIAEPAST